MALILRSLKALCTLYFCCDVLYSSILTTPPMLQIMPTVLTTANNISLLGAMVVLRAAPVLPAQTRRASLFLDLPLSRAGKGHIPIPGLVPILLLLAWSVRAGRPNARSLPTMGGVGHPV